jgi:hypothetical protein
MIAAVIHPNGPRPLSSRLSALPNGLYSLTGKVGHVSNSDKGMPDDLGGNFFNYGHGFVAPVATRTNAIKNGMPMAPARPMRNASNSIISTSFVPNTHQQDQRDPSDSGSVASLERTVIHCADQFDYQSPQQTPPNQAHK